MAGTRAFPLERNGWVTARALCPPYAGCCIEAAGRPKIQPHACVPPFRCVWGLVQRDTRNALIKHLIFKRFLERNAVPGMMTESGCRDSGIVTTNCAKKLRRRSSAALQ